MRHSFARLAALTIAMLLPSLPFHAQGLIAASSKSGNGAAIKVVDQKAVVYFSQGKEDLFVSPSFEGPGKNFAWIIPVPAQPKVEIMPGALFHDLQRFIEQSKTNGPSPEGEGAAPPSAEKTKVKLLESKVVGAYQVSVLAARDARALLTWLRQHNYNLPTAAAETLRQYVRDGWTFVAVRIDNPEIAKGLSGGTLAPLRLSFPAKRPVFPARFASLNGEPFFLSLYLLMPVSEIGEGVTAIDLVSGPKHCGRIRKEATLDAGQEAFPTLSKLTDKQIAIFQQSETLIDPKDCVADFVWATPIRAARK